MRRCCLIAGMLLIAVGCNRQDAESLGRIGRLLGQRVEKMKASSNPNLPDRLPGYSPVEKQAVEQKETPSQ